VFAAELISTLVNNSKSGAVYKACTQGHISQGAGVPYDYAANFDAGRVDVWDSNLNPIENTAAFIDSSATPILKIQVATTGVGTALIRASGVNIPGVTAV
jgi:hypothetical protein